MTNARAKALIIDDDAEIGSMLAEVCAGLGWQASSTVRADEFLEACDRGVDVAFIDLRMPDTDGVDLLRKLATRDAPPAIILVSGLSGSALHTAHRLGELLGLDVLGTLRKPFTIAQVRTLLHRERPRPARASDPFDPVLDAQEVAQTIASGGFDVQFQPIVRCWNGRTVGAEALVRWHHPRAGSVPPMAFIPILREIGGMGALTRFVLARAIAALRESRALDPEFTMSINVPIECFVRDPILGELLEALDAAGLPPSAMTLEIPEDELVAEAPDVLDALLRARIAGVGVAIDDYGAGQAQLPQARRVPATELKIDRALVADVGTSEWADECMRHVVQLGHGLRMRVVAEGVESMEAAAIVRSMGCDAIQGFVYAPAIPAAMLVSRLKKEVGAAR